MNPTFLPPTARPTIEQAADAMVARMKQLGVKLRHDGNGLYRVPFSAVHLLTLNEVWVLAQPAELTAAVYRSKLAGSQAGRRSKNE